LATLRHDLGVADGRRFEYTSLRDRKKWDVIQSWLSAFDSMHGVAFAMHRDVVSAFHTNAPGETAELLKLTKDLGEQGGE
jgi:hypothetical protein